MNRLNTGSVSNARDTIAFSGFSSDYPVFPRIFGTWRRALVKECCLSGRKAAEFADFQIEFGKSKY